MKKITLAKLSLSASILLTSQFAFAEVHPGKALETSANCLKCHASQPYNPAKTKSYPALVKMVSFCNNNLNAGMFEDEVETLADYLNQTYYHYDK